MGQTHVQKFMPELLALIEAGALHPERIISHEMPLKDAAQGYATFANKQHHCRKVVLRAG